MTLRRRRFLKLVGAAAVAAPLRSAWGLDYPVRPVRLVVGFPAKVVKFSGIKPH